MGLDGQKAYMMNFWRAIEKHQACLSTDVAGSRKACPMNFPRHPTIIWFVPAKRLNFPRPGKIIRPLSGRSPRFVGLDGQKA